MTTILIVNQLGNISELLVKKFKIEDLYKKCNYRKQDGFELRNTWNVKLGNKSYVLELHGKIDGRANMENKYEMPPPVDKVLYFGALAIINKDSDNNIVSLSIKEWEDIYEKLYGGFEDLDATAEEDENEMDELKDVPKHLKTKSGYLKDGFVVDEGEDEDDEYDDEDEDDDDELSYEEYEYSD